MLTDRMISKSKFMKNIVKISELDKEVLDIIQDNIKNLNLEKEN